MANPATLTALNAPRGVLRPGAGYTQPRRVRSAFGVCSLRYATPDSPPARSTGCSAPTPQPRCTTSNTSGRIEDHRVRGRRHTRRAPARPHAPPHPATAPNTPPSAHTNTSTPTRPDPSPPNPDSHHQPGLPGSLILITLIALGAPRSWSGSSAPDTPSATTTHAHPPATDTAEPRRARTRDRGPSRIGRSHGPSPTGESESRPRRSHGPPSRPPERQPRRSPPRPPSRRPAEPSATPVPAPGPVTSTLPPEPDRDRDRDPRQTDDRPGESRPVTGGDDDRPTHTDPVLDVDQSRRMPGTNT